MTRWLVQLEGNPCDLEEFPYWFPDGDVHAIEENGSVYLVGPAFEALSEASQVREAALQTVDEFSAIITLLGSSLQRPKMGRVFREDESGKRQAFIFLGASITGRSKTGRATITVGGVEQARHSPTQAQILFSGSRMDTHLRVAISLWADPLRTWPRLYRVLEEIEQYLGQPVQQASFCSDNQRKRFTRSANAAEISGKDARHALGKFEPPKDPMDLAEATVFIGRLLQAALAHAAVGRLPKTDTA
jgi:hypothetical protein